jgi:hypothetical protein
LDDARPLNLGNTASDGLLKIFQVGGGPKRRFKFAQQMAAASQRSADSAASERIAILKTVARLSQPTT